MALKLNTAPAFEPISMAEAAEHLRVDIDEEDGTIVAFIAAARHYCEGFQNRAYITQTWELWLDEFPGKGQIQIPLPPLQSVSSVKYYDVDDNEYTISSADYFVDAKNEPGWVVLNSGTSWPSMTLRPANGVCVTFIAGFATAAEVPDTWKAAIKLMLGHLYENREQVVAGAAPSQLPLGVEALLWLDRIF